jgi:hypothetical protein
MKRALTKPEQEGVLKVLKGACHIYGVGIANAKTAEERFFYETQLAEARHLISIFESKTPIAIEEEEDEEEDPDS